MWFGFLFCAEGIRVSVSKRAEQEILFKLQFMCKSWDLRVSAMSILRLVLWGDSSIIACRAWGDEEWGNHLREKILNEIQIFTFCYLKRCTIFFLSCSRNIFLFFLFLVVFLKWNNFNSHASFNVCYVQWIFKGSEVSMNF